MVRQTIFWVCLLFTAIVFNCSASIQPDDYKVTLLRNPFGIKPPPPTAPTNQTSLSTNIHLVGRTRLSGPAKAMFLVKDNKNVMVPVSLREGEKENDLTVLSISD